MLGPKQRILGGVKERCMIPHLEGTKGKAVAQQGGLPIHLGRSLHSALRGAGGLKSQHPIDL